MRKATSCPDCGFWFACDRHSKIFDQGDDREIMNPIGLILAFLILAGLFLSGLTFCAPAVVKESEYQSRRLGEAMFQEAKYRANRGINHEGF